MKVIGICLFGMTLVFAGITACGSSKTVCANGESAGCVGPGACAGFQVCQADGTFNACTCGAAPDGGIDASVNDAGASDSGDASTMDGGMDASTCVMGSPPAQNNTLKSDPAPAFTATMNGFILHKELTGFGSYGKIDAKADIAYVNETAAWTFAVPAVTIKSAKVVLSLVITDDMTNAPNKFTYRIWSGTCATDTPLNPPHGTAMTPGMFDNWVSVTVDATPTSGSNFVVELTNTSPLPMLQWFAIDWVELQITTQ